MGELKNEVVEAVRERVRMADAWSKDTGYQPHDYFDVMTDLRRMLKAFDDLARRADDAGRLREAWKSDADKDPSRGGSLTPVHFDATEKTTWQG